MLERFYVFIATLPADKKDHFLTLPLLAYAVLLVGPRSPWTLLVAEVLCFTVALWKELQDLGDPRHRAEVGDVVAGLLGTALPAALYWFKVLR